MKLLSVSLNLYCEKQNFVADNLLTIYDILLHYFFCHARGWIFYAFKICDIIFNLSLNCHWLMYILVKALVSLYNSVFFCAYQRSGNWLVLIPVKLRQFKLRTLKRLDTDISFLVVNLLLSIEQGQIWFCSNILYSQQVYLEE